MTRGTEPEPEPEPEPELEPHAKGVDEVVPLGAQAVQPSAISKLCDVESEHVKETGEKLAIDSVLVVPGPRTIESVASSSSLESLGAFPCDSFLAWHVRVCVRALRR